LYDGRIQGIESFAALCPTMYGARAAPLPRARRVECRNIVLEFLECHAAFSSRKQKTWI
jgi:hypothetical protein